VVPGRTAQGVSGWLAGRPTPWRAAIDAVTLDPYAGYARGLADGLPHAELVVDHFHAVRLANAALDEARRRVQQEDPWASGPQSRPALSDPPPASRRPRAAQRARLGSHPDRPERRRPGRRGHRPSAQGPVNRQELLREVSATTSQRRARLERFYAHCRTADLVELRRLATTVRHWEPEILGWHRTGLSNGPTEAMNLLIKKIKRVGHGFRNFENYRLRLLLHCGVDDRLRRIRSGRRGYRLGCECISSRPSST
jgi:transposase